MSSAVLLAVISAVFFGLNASVVKMAVHKRPYSINAVITFTTAAVIMWVVALVTKNPFPSGDALPFFVLAGILAPGLSALFNFESFKRVGISTTASLVATSPLFGTIFAILLLGESVNAPIASGTLMIVFGVFILSWFRAKKHISLKNLPLPLIGSFLIGIAAVVSKHGLNLSPTVFTGIAIATTAGVATQLVYITALNKWKNISKSFSDLKYYLLAGLFISAALTLLFTALSIGDVVIVFPINHSQALFSILFSWLFLRQHDFITKYTIIGAVAIVLGAALVTIGR